MIDGYDAKSCSALQRPFYRPIEAAIRWCGLIARESEILGGLGQEAIPKLGQFPMWPCLRANAEKIFDAINNGEIPHGRDGRTVSDREHVNSLRLTVRHTDLRAWFTAHEPGQKPAFLFDEIERATRSAITVDAYTALQADRDALKARLERATEIYKEQRATIEAQAAELAALKTAPAPAGDDLTARERTSLLNTVGALLVLLKAESATSTSDAAVIRALVENYGEDRPGISKSGLENRFAEAKRTLGQ